MATDDYRLRLALSQLGSSQGGPVSSWAGGLNRVLQSMLGAYGIRKHEGKEQFEEDKRELAMVGASKKLGIPTETLELLTPEQQGSLVAKQFEAPTYGTKPISGIDPKTGKPAFLQLGSGGQQRMIEGLQPMPELQTLNLGGTTAIADKAALARAAAQAEGGLLNIPMTPTPSAELGYRGRMEAANLGYQGKMAGIGAANQRAAANRAAAEARFFAGQELENQRFEKGLKAKIDIPMQLKQAEAQELLPRAISQGEAALKSVDELLKHPGFESSVGATLKPYASKIPGTKESDFMNRLEQTQGTAFLEAFTALKGAGQITEVEGRKATQAMNRMNASTSEREFRAAAKDFSDIVQRGVKNAQIKAGVSPTGIPGAGAQGAGAQGAGAQSELERLKAELARRKGAIGSY